MQMLARWLRAYINSWHGFKWACAKEKSFREDLIISAVLTVIAPFVARDAVSWGILMMPVVLLLVAELLNTAIEKALDRIGNEYHDLTKIAKDVGSAAVMVALIALTVIWGVILLV